jgi:hypothetical protein
MQARFSIVEREQARASLKLAVVLSRVIYHQFGFQVTQNSQIHQTKFSKVLCKILNFRSSERHQARLFGRVVTKINPVNLP